MSTEFKPYIHGLKQSEFTALEYHNPENDHADQTIEPIEVIDEVELAKQTAIAQGYAEGMEAAQQEINEKKAELVNWIKLLQKPVMLLDDSLTQEIIQTLLWLGQYCIGVEITQDPSKLKGLLNEIKGELPSLSENKQFVMHPDDVEWIKAQVAEDMIPGLPEILVADSSLARGDFYLKGGHSELDGRLQTRLLTLFAKYINKDNLVTPIKTQE